MLLLQEILMYSKSKGKIAVSMHLFFNKRNGSIIFKEMEKNTS